MINCIIVDSDKTARKTIENALNHVKHLDVVLTCKGLSEASEILLTQPVHILFLDIPSPDKSELNFLDNLKYERPKIIVTSTSSGVATKAFDIDAVDFILKPVTIPRVVKAIAKALKMKNNDHKENGQPETSIFLKMDHKFIKVDLKDVYLVEALADYVHVHTPLKRYTVHSTMKSMDDRLPQEDFLRVHKSYIVRLDRITEVEKETLNIEKRTIPVGNTYRRELMEKLKII